MRTRLEELLAVTEQDHAGTLIVCGLLDEQVFDATWRHPRVLAAVRHVLGDDYRLTGVVARGLRPGHGQQSTGVVKVYPVCGMPVTRSVRWLNSRKRMVPRASCLDPIATRTC